MQTTPFQRQVKAADLPLDRLMANKNIPERDKLQAASRAFEAIMLRQILESTQKTVIQSSVNAESSTKAIYRDLITTQLADGIAKSGQFGLARSFDKEWLKQLGTAGKDEGSRMKDEVGTTTAAGAVGIPSPYPTIAPALKPLHGAPVLKPLIHEPDLKAYRHE
jgi:Rod binding domain-containing protein